MVSIPDILPHRQPLYLYSSLAYGLDTHDAMLNYTLIGGMHNNMTGGWACYVGGMCLLRKIPTKIYSDLCM
jgi:hypothetical protein